MGTETLQFLSVCVHPLSLKLAFMKTFKYSPKMLSGQKEHCWNGGHLHDAALLIMFKRNVLLEEYPWVIVFAKRKLN